MARNVSPCMGCDRVKDPRDCENKSCKVWRGWFIDRWEALRTGVRQQMDGTPVPVGVVVSGTHYAAPNQVEAYLHNDPCQACLCPRELCDTPCRLRKDWQQARQDVLL